ncbi:hypothetical protein B0919_22195 [Hymenobacter sp. CRA2]|nr:hypothetical protein B0919_22195 [Hymenobacter sp. CRA2]
MMQILAWRLGRTLFTAWLITSVVFLLTRGLETGQPQLLSDTALSRQNFRQEAESLYRQRLGLSVPLFYCRVLPWRWYGTPNQYHEWLNQLIRGQLGTSFRDGVSVMTHLREALGVTLPLTGSALLLSIFLALLLALRAARTERTLRWYSNVAYLVDSFPLFAIGLLLLLLFANPDFWPLFPAYGLGSDEHASLWSTAYHLALPALTLTLVSIPGILLPTAAALHQQSLQPYVATARAKGVSSALLWRRHILPNALPVFITRCGDLLPGVVAGAVVVEVLFALPGMGRLLAEAAAARDLPVLVGGIWLIAFTRLAAWLLADVANMWIDPRHQTS